MKTTIFTNGRVIDPANGRDEENSSLLVKDGIICPPDTSAPSDSHTIDLQGKWIIPGLIDMHVHLREPGQEYKEDVESGTRAAAAGDSRLWPACLTPTPSTIVLR